MFGLAQEKLGILIKFLFLKWFIYVYVFVMCSCVFMACVYVNVCMCARACVYACP